MSATAKLIGNLEATQEDVDELRPHVAKLDKGMKDVLSVLDEVHSISDNLSTLDDDMGTVSLVLALLSPAPVVGSVCSTAKKPLDLLKKGVHPVRNKANQLDKALKPIREGLTKAEAQVAGAIDRLNQLKDAAGKLESTLDTTYSCLQKKKAQGLMDAEDKFSAGVNPEVKALNKALTTATDIAKRVEKKLQNLEDVCKSMAKIGKPIDDVLDNLKVLSKLLDPIEDAMNQKIKVPYSVKVKGKWWQPWKWKVSTTNFTFRIKDILDGINTGIGWVNDQLMKLARKALNALDLDFPKLPGIPGLDELEKKLDNVLGFVGQLKDDLDSIKGDLDSIFGKIAYIEGRLTAFDIKC